MYALLLGTLSNRCQYNITITVLYVYEMLNHFRSAETHLVFSFGRSRPNVSVILVIIETRSFTNNRWNGFVHSADTSLNTYVMLMFKKESPLTMMFMTLKVIVFEICRHTNIIIITILQVKMLESHWSISMK